MPDVSFPIAIKNLFEVVIFEVLLENGRVAIGDNDVFNLVEVLGENGFDGEVGEGEGVAIFKGEHAQVVEAEGKERFLKELVHVELALQHGEVDG